MTDEDREMLREMVGLLSEIAENTRKVKKEKVEKPSHVPDDAWLKGLANDPTYKGINVLVEFGKAMNWYSTRNQSVTRRKFIDWLNRVERPLSPALAPKPDLPPVMTKVTQPLPKGEAPPKEVADRLSRILGRDMSF